MAQFQAIGGTADRVMAALIHGLEREFGRSAGAALAARFIDAEGVDFHWEARASERGLGLYQSQDDDTEYELDRVAIIGFLDGEWFVATCIVDGDGQAQGMLGCRHFDSEKAAREAFGHAH